LLFAKAILAVQQKPITFKEAVGSAGSVYKGNKSSPSEGKKKKGKVSEHPVCDSEFLNKVLHALRQSGTKCKLLLERGDVSTLVSFPMLITSAQEDGKSS